MKEEQAVDETAEMMGFGEDEPEQTRPLSPAVSTPYRCPGRLNAKWDDEKKTIC
jgi:hypothetical protein